MAKISMKAARVAAGLTQEQLADKMGVSRQSIHKWENGLSTIRTAYFFAFCRVTGFSEDDILLPEESTECR